MTDRDFAFLADRTGSTQRLADRLTRQSLYHALAAFALVVGGLLLLRFALG